MKYLSMLFYTIATWFSGSAFYKLYAYQNPSNNGTANTFSTKDVVNAYVGSDAYNYIINSGRATAYFVFALICVIIASTFLILDRFNKSKTAITDPVPQPSESLTE